MSERIDVVIYDIFKIQIIFNKKNKIWQGNIEFSMKTPK